MKKNQLAFFVVAIVVIAAGVVIAFWNTIKPKVDEAAKAVANNVGGLPGLPAKKIFTPGTQVDSTADHLKFRSSPAVKSDNIVSEFSNGQPVGVVVQDTDANGWVKVERFSAQLEAVTGYVYSAYLKQTNAWAGGGAGGHW